MKSFICLLIFFNSIALFCQTIYTIPNASVQPKFVFPIYFEEGNGQKDTLYLGYDSLATGYGVSTANNYDDSIFGVKKVPIDTNLFYVGWGVDFYESLNPLTLEDSVYKSNVSCLYGSSAGPQTQFPGIQNILMNKGMLPLKISWDKNLFYSDSLPFISNPPAPKGQGRFIISYSSNEYETENGSIICQLWTHIIVTDTTVLSFCTARDSMTISNFIGDSIPVTSGSITFNINQWSGINVDIEKPNNEVFEIKIFPNPFTDNFTVSVNNNHSFYAIKVRDVLGNMVYEDEKISGDTKVFTGNLRQGIYIVETVFEHYVSRQKIIKQ